MEKTNHLTEILDLLRDAFACPDPHPSTIYAARYLITEYDRNDLPDWVAALAGGNAETWEDLIDFVRAEMKED